MEQATTRFSGNGAGLRSPEQIEREIETTRNDLADTVAAVVEKVDIRRHAREKVERARGKAAPVALGAAVIVTGTAITWIVLQRRNESRLTKAKRDGRRIKKRAQSWIHEISDRAPLPR